MERLLQVGSFQSPLHKNLPDAAEFSMARKASLEHPLCILKKLKRIPNEFIEKTQKKKLRTPHHLHHQILENLNLAHIRWKICWQWVPFKVLYTKISLTPPSFQ